MANQSKSLKPLPPQAALPAGYVGCKKTKSNKSIDVVHDLDSLLKPWDHHKWESALMYNSFQIYIKLGPTRSIAKCLEEMINVQQASKFGDIVEAKKRAGNPNRGASRHKAAHECKVTTIYTWSRICQWQSRALAWDQYLADIERKAIIDKRIEMAKRQAELGMRLQTIGMDAIETRSSIVDQNGNQVFIPGYDTAIKMIDTGSKVERAALGVDDGEVKVQVQVTNQSLRGLDDTELDQLFNVYTKINVNGV